MVGPSQRLKLEEHLRSLHEMLENRPDISPEARELLRTVMMDIYRELDGNADKGTDWSELRQRWSEAVYDFEGEHPWLTQIVEQITTALANAGI